MRLTLRILIGIVLINTIVKAQNFNEIQKTVATDRAISDNYGDAVSISGDYAIIGASLEDEDASGSFTLNEAGSAYILERDINGNWSQTQKLVASDREESDRFGFSVAISGNYAVVGAPLEEDGLVGQDFFLEPGAAYIFERDVTGTWNQVQKIVASDREDDLRFGWSVAINGDRIIVGTDHLFNGEDGNDLNLGGAAYIFERDNGLNVWNLAQKIQGPNGGESDRFGNSVSISDDLAIIGAPGEGDELGTLSEIGAAYIYERDNISGTWILAEKIIASDRAGDDNFGASVGITATGSRAIVGAPFEDEDSMGQNTLEDAGSCYVYERVGNLDWNEITKVVATDRAAFGEYGTVAAINGNFAVIGSPGKAYVIERNVLDWSQSQQLVASDANGFDFFGKSVTISGNDIIVGASLEDENELGTNTMINAGAAYFYERNGVLNTNDFDLSTDLAVFPNPAITDIVINMGIEGTARLYDLNGRFIDSKKLTKGDNYMNISSLSKSIYFLKIKTVNGSITRKIMIR